MWDNILRQSESIGEVCEGGADKYYTKKNLIMLWISDCNL